MRIHLKLPGRWGRVSRYLGWLREALIKPVVSKCYCRHAYIPLTKDGSFWHWRVIDPGAAPRCLNLHVYLLYKSDWNVCLHRHRVVTSNNIRPSFQSKFYGPSTYYQLNRLKFRETKPELGHFIKVWLHNQPRRCLWRTSHCAQRWFQKFWAAEMAQHTPNSITNVALRWRRISEYAAKDNVIDKNKNVHRSSSVQTFERVLLTYVGR